MSQQQSAMHRSSNLDGQLLDIGHILYMGNEADGRGEPWSELEHGIRGGRGLQDGGMGTAQLPHQTERMQSMVAEGRLQGF